MRRILISLFAIALLGACANVDTKTAPKDENEYVTGSRIPRKDNSGSGVAVMSREALEQAQRSSGGPSVKGGENLK